MACKRLNIVLIGKTGNGKSAVGNSILHRSVFKTSNSSKSCTQLCELESARHEDVVINVIDTPGLMDTSKSQEEILQLLGNALSLCQCLLNAFVFVLRCDIRCTDEELKTYKTFKSFFGSDFLKVCIIVFTHGDVFEEREDPQSFDQWLQEGEGLLKEIKEECNSRVVFFYNTKRSEYKEKRQFAVNQLLKMIIDNNMLYTDDHFTKAEDSRKNMAIEDKLPQLQAKYQEQLSLLQAEYEKALNNSQNVSDQSIQSVLDQARKIMDSINEDANGTDILNFFKDCLTKEIQHIEALKHSDNRQIKMQKIAEYNELLKNAPSTAPIVLTGFETFVSVATGATAAYVTYKSFSPFKLYEIVQIAINSGQKAFASANETYKQYSVRKEYNKRLSDLDNEIQHLN